MNRRLSNNCLTFVFIFKGTESLTFSPSEVFSGESVTLTCGPPPPNLNLGSDWIAEWRRNNNLIYSDDEHSFSNNNGQATLTVSKSFATDNGKKNCRSATVQSIGDLYSYIIYTFLSDVLNQHCHYFQCLA